MKTQETIADIIAWLRRPREGENAYLTLWRDEIADRLEAALKRERAKIEADALTVGGIVEAERKRERGDCAKMREAVVTVYNVLEKLRPFSLDLGDIGRRREFSHLVCLAKNRLDAALAAPPRNCDRMNVDDAFSAFTFMCDNTDCRDCPYKKNNKFGDSELCAMLFLYDNGNGGKEGGAK